MIPRILTNLVFWTWNLCFVAVLWFGLGPWLLPTLLEATVEGEVPADFTAFFVGALLVPAFVIAAGWRLRGDWRGLAALFYGVEIPALLLGLGRVFLVRELTPAVAAALGVLALATAHLAWDRLRPPASPAGSLLRVATAAASLLVGLWIGVGLGVYAPPLAVATGKAAWDAARWLLTEGGAREILREGRFVVLPWIALGVATMGVLAMVPVAFAALHLAALRRAVVAARPHWGVAAAAVPGVLLLAGIGGIGALCAQPQVEAFARLAEAPTTDAARADRLGHDDAIRAGLLNAYLWRFRYLSDRDTDMAGWAWKEAFGAGGDVAEAVFDTMAEPFQYRRVEGRDDEDRAAKLYADFFDCELQRCEQATVLHAVQATWSREDRQAGALDAGREQVHLDRQDLAVTVDGDLGRFALHEVYRNDTTDEQEIRYTFSLPETAALTGLWLGDTDDVARRIPARLAPRGAAQAVYLRSVQRRTDPALLEQIGPRQYRLRVFPIAPGKPMHLWLEGVAFAGPDGVPLPVLGEARNVYWDETTERRVDAVPAPASLAWLPAHAGPAGTPRAHAATLAGSAVAAEPVADDARTPWKGGRYAIVLDRSRSMARHRREVADAFAWAEEALVPGSTVDLYLTSSTSRGEAPARRAGLAGFDPAGVLWYGALSPGELLAQFATLAGDDRYDAVFVLTDDGLYPRDGEYLAPVRSPLWLVHLGGAMGPGYDDATTSLVRATGGGAATDLHAAALAASGRTDTSWEADGYRFTVTPATDALADPAFAPVAAAQLVRAMDRPDLDTVTLDGVHAIAKAGHVVTPFSSMIVLVEQWQKNALDAAEQAADRFDREVEPDAETLDKPLSLGADVSGVPEPATWILGGIGAALLAARRRYSVS